MKYIKFEKLHYIIQLSDVLNVSFTMNKHWIEDNVTA